MPPIHYVCGLLVLSHLTLPEGLAYGRDSKAKEVVDFENSHVDATWTATGRVAARIAVPPVQSPSWDNSPRLAMHLSATGPGGILTKSGVIRQDWTRVSEISLWIYASSSAASKQPVLEVQLTERDAYRRFWQKVHITEQGWKEYRLPLCWFRTGDGRLPTWSSVERLGLIFRGEGEIWIGWIGVAEGEDQSQPMLTPERLLPVAFPANSPGELKVKETKHVCLVSNAPELDIKALSEHLEKVVDRLHADMPFLAKLNAKGTLLVFATREQYQAFIPRFAERLQAKAGPPGGGTGFTVHSVASSYWDARLGPLRPVYMHEFIHSYIESNLLLPCIGEWFHEGLANLYQLRIHRQDNIRELVTQGLRDPKRQIPLQEICNGKHGSVPMRCYWQVATVMEMLLGHPRYRDSFPRLVTAFQQSNSTNLGPHLKPIFNTDWETLYSDWQEYALGAYADEGNK